MQDGVDGIRFPNSMVLGLVSLDQGRQHIEPVPVQSVGVRIHERLDLRKGCLMVAFIPDRLNVHDTTFPSE